MPRFGASTAAMLRGSSNPRLARASRAFRKPNARPVSKRGVLIGYKGSRRWLSQGSSRCASSRKGGILLEAGEEGEGVEVRAMSSAVSEADEEVREIGWDRGFSAKYELTEERLGQGSFGTVWSAVERATGQVVAVKVLPKRRKGEWEKYSALLKNEVFCWEALEGCTDVVKLHGYYEDETSLYIVQEKCLGGDLQHYLNDHGKMSECEASQVIAGVLRMLDQCHDRGVCFGDVKPSNFMLKASYPCRRHLVDDTAPKGIIMLKAIDFGCSQLVSEDAKLKKRTGTPLYMAPDIFFGWYGVEVDVWAAGMLLYQLISGKLPFFGDNADKMSISKPFAILQAFMDSELEFKGDTWDGVSNSLKDLITKMLDMEYSARISAKDALQHPWILQHAACKEDVEVASSNILKFPGSPGASLGKGTNDCKDKDGKGGAI